jgi:hypothetical protein
MKRLATQSFVLIVLLIVSSCAARSSSSSFRQAYDKRLERLENEREKLKRQTDPVGRTKAEIRISEILLTLVRDAVKTGDLELMEQRLEEYVTAIEDARQTMMQTGRDAHRRPGGFKDLEIALRRQVRQLEDIGQGLTFDQREPLDKAKEQAADIRDEMLKALFGEQNAPSRKG